MEKLTGKCKEDLLSFYWDNYIGKTRFLEQKSETEDFFNSLYPILKNALIIEFFDSVGIYINTPKTYTSKKLFGYRIIKDDYLPLATAWIYKTRSEAETEAIIKANELYNSKQ